MKILFCCKYGSLAPSSRIRILQYLPYISKNYAINTNFLLGNNYVSRYYHKQPQSKIKIIYSYLRRLFNVLFSNADLVILEKELFPYLPYLFEKLCLYNKRYIIDIDDAVFLKYDDLVEHHYLAKLFFKNKFQQLYKNSTAVLAGSPYLVEHAKTNQANQVYYFPTVIDTLRYKKNITYKEDTVTIGWIGTLSTVNYVKQILEVLDSLASKYVIELVIIGAELHVTTKNLNIRYEKWAEDKEVELISSIDIGVMPLDNNKWELGKCGYKLIQYMGCSKPVIASSIGANKVIVTEECGFLCSNHEQWYNAFERLILDPELRRQMGEAGYKRVEESYSINSNIKLLGYVLNKALSS
jgi:glycosyltransferase involved in cell wall biosynthesis